MILSAGLKEVVQSLASEKGQGSGVLHNFSRGQLELSRKPSDTAEQGYYILL